MIFAIGYVEEKSSSEQEQNTIEWDDVVFEVELLKSQRDQPDYILGLIFEKNKKVKSKGELIEDARRVISPAKHWQSCERESDSRDFNQPD